MAQPSVVVAFTSRCGATETIAHAAAVGTVNARALPRLRRLTDDGAPAPAECADTLRRLRKEYVPPAESDIANAPGLIIVPSAGATLSSDAWPAFIELLDRLASAGKLAGKIAAVVDADDPQTVAVFSAALSERGLTLIAAEGRDPRAHGRAVGAAVISAAQQTSR